MEMCIEKIGMFRLERNPKNQELKMDLKWTIDYTEIGLHNVSYICNLKTSPNFPLNLRVEGFLNMSKIESFSKNEVSEVIFDRCTEILLNLVNISKEYNFEIQCIDSLEEHGNIKSS
jgi:hypothetical protein